MKNISRETLCVIIIIIIAVGSFFIGRNHKNEQLLDVIYTLDDYMKMAAITQKYFNQLQLSEKVYNDLTAIGYKLDKREYPKQDKK